MEVDETYIGLEPGAKIKQGVGHKLKVLSLVDRTTGRARSIHMDRITTETILAAVSANVAKEARLLTDEAKWYQRVGATMAAHGHTVHGKGEYVSTVDPTIHTNTVEGMFSIFKRGMRGIYQHAAPRHLHRYLAEIDFRYSNLIALGVNDIQRADTILSGVTGRRLTYQTASGQA